MFTPEKSTPESCLNECLRMYISATNNDGEELLRDAAGWYFLKRDVNGEIDLHNGYVQYEIEDPKGYPYYNTLYYRIPATRLSHLFAEITYRKKYGSVGRLSNLLKSTHFE